MIPHYENLENITADDVRGLIGLAESDRIDFKREAYTGNNKEWLKDISAMSNAAGGCICIGIDEAEGEATEIVGIDAVVDLDQLILRLSNSSESGIQPRILIKFQRVEVDDKVVLLIATPRSHSQPHQLKESGRFHRRLHSASTITLDVQQLRRAFVEGADEQRRAIQLHYELQSRYPGTEADWVYAHLSLIPTPERGDIIELREYMATHPNTPARVRLSALVTSFEPTFEGYLADRQEYGLLAVQGDGVIHRRCGYPIRESNLFSLDRLAAEMVQTCRAWRDVCSEANIQPPLIACATFVGTRNRRIYANFPRTSRPIERSELAFSPVIHDSADDAWEEQYVPWFDRVANAAGFHKWVPNDRRSDDPIDFHWLLNQCGLS